MLGVPWCALVLCCITVVVDGACELCLPMSCRCFFPAAENSGAATRGRGLSSHGTELFHSVISGMFDVNLTSLDVLVVLCI